MASLIRLFLLRLRHKWNWSVVKLGFYFLYVFLAIVIVLGIAKSDMFNAGNSSKQSSSNRAGSWRAELDKLNSPNVPKAILDFEAEVRSTIQVFDPLFHSVSPQMIPGAGENGKGIDIGDPQLVAETVKKFAHNRIASDRMPLNRSLPDVRHAECKMIDYDKDLPSASVILIFNNEILSTLLRTVWSILNRTPEEYLKEIILIDDGSDLPEIVKTLPLYLKHRCGRFLSIF